MAYSEAYLAQQKAKGLKPGNYNVGISGPVAGAAKTITAPEKQVAKPSGNFISNVAGQTFDVAKTAGKATASFVKNVGVDVARQAKGTAEFLHPEIYQARLASINQANQILSTKQAEVVKAYKSGKMSKKNYQDSLKGLSDSFNDLSKEAQAVERRANPVDRASDTAWTAINILSGSSASLIRAGGKTVVKEALPKVLGDKVATTLTDTITRVPAMKELIARNGQKVATREVQKHAGETTEQWLARGGKQIAIGLLIKRPIFYQTNVGLANDAYKEILDGNYGEAAKSSAWIGAQMVGGGPIGWFVRQGKAGVSHVKSLARGKGSFIDEVSRQIGDGNPSQIARFLNTLQERAPNEFKEASKTFRILQHTNLASANDNVSQAADNVLNHYREMGRNLEDVTPGEIYRDMNKWAQADELAQNTIKQGVVKGVNPQDVTKYAVVRWDRSTQSGLISEIEKAEDNSQSWLDVIMQMSERPGVGWGNNNLLMNKLTTIIGNARTRQEVIDGIRGISTASTMLSGMPKKVAKQLADLGYTIAAPYGGNKIARVDYDNIEETTRKIVTGAIKQDNELFDAARDPEPVLEAITGALTRLGVSPISANDVAHTKLSEALIGSLGELQVARPLGLTDNIKDGDFVMGGRAILSRLEQYVENKKGALILRKISSGKSAVTDIRQLTNDEIVDALGVTKAEAKSVSRAVRQAYTDVPLEYRGLGDKIVDHAINLPLSPMRYYLRAQSAFRYTYNPFFRTQEQVETSVLASMNANKFIWPSRRLDATINELETFGVFKGNVSGIGADDQVIGRISANLTTFQKRNLAGLAETIAKGQGKTVTQVLQDNPEQIEDALKIIVQYPRQGGVSSPLARTINVAFFPMRYNIKVSQLAAEKIATMPPSLQLATLVGFQKSREWLKSDEGILWQSEHAEAIQVWKWATPVGSIQSFSKVLSGGGESLGDWGLLGGLPFGFISQILDAEGIININKPYVNMTSGEVLPDYIPQTTKAQSAVALQTFLGTLFSFPGRTLGLPGKESTIREFTRNFIDTNGSEFEKNIRTDDLTELQKKMIQVIKGDTSQETLDSLYFAPANGQFEYYTIPPMSLPIVKPINQPQPVVPKRTGLPSNKRSRTATGKRPKPLPQPIPPR